ncbi:MAG TPA: dipeptide epimerase [Polyangiaceae bacterium]|nr:dipeptide epimerase [Polyangiaceae bacterium]
MPQVVHLSARPWDIELNEPFGIATGAQVVAANVLVKVQLADGTVGLGESAPFPAVSGETQQMTLAALQTVTERVIGRNVEHWEQIALDVRDPLGVHKSALCGLETALLDAYCKVQKISLWAWAKAHGATLPGSGDVAPRLVTDITIPTGTVRDAERAAHAAVAQGFRILKIKVGGADLHLDAQRLFTVLTASSNTQLVVDGNAALTVSDAIALVQGLGSLSDRVVLYEQPTPKHDLAALREVRRATQVRVAADESAANELDVARLAEADAVDAINIKIMKSGIVESLRMIDAAKRLGLGLMIGGMVESELAMTTSACIAAGIGGFDYIDLDTPLFMKGTPTHGGVRRHGPQLEVDSRCFGHGVEPNL